MPRNVAKPLSPADAAVQNVRHHDLLRRTGPVTVSYLKRDGSKSSSRGKVGFFSGQPGFDTGSVTIETEDKGPRTVNLHRIIQISD